MAEPERAAYVASKHALIGLTKQMAMEFGKQQYMKQYPAATPKYLKIDYFLS
jgi:hypothetical protein